MVNPLIESYSAFENSDYNQFRSELLENKIRSMQTYCDVQMIETEKYIFFMKAGFDPISSNILPPGVPIVVVQTTRDSNVIETSMKPYYDSDRHIVIFGNTFEHSDGLSLIHI